MRPPGASYVLALALLLPSSRSATLPSSFVDPSSTSSSNAERYLRSPSSFDALEPSLVPVTRGDAPNLPEAQAPHHANPEIETEARTACFPSLGFDATSLYGDSSPNMPFSDWWCDYDNEQGFLGFSYDIGACKPHSQMLADFTRMRTQFNARYVRIYSACDDDGFMDDVIDAAWTSGIGVYALIWFGFTGGKEWMTRRDQLLETMGSNPLAPYVIRSIDVGSEPLFDWDLTPSQLAQQVLYVKNQTAAYSTTVAISEMQYGFTVQGNSQAVLNAIDVVHAHELPFFDKNAKTGASAGPSVYNSTSWFVQKTGGTKKIIFTQTGWPTNTNVWKANSKTAVASIASSSAYVTLLDSMCEDLKTLSGRGGVGWFWQIWDDEDLDGWGVLDGSDKPKFTFAPRTSC